MIHDRPPPQPPRAPAACGVTRDGAPIPLPFTPDAAGQLTGRGHLDEAQRAWQAHVEAGRIGVPVRPSAEWYARAAANEAACGVRRRGNVW